MFAGLFFTEGELWHEQRRYALRNLRDYGFGRRHDGLELEHGEEILSLCDLLKNGPKYDFEKVFSQYLAGGWVKRAPFTRIGRMDKPLLGFSFKKLSDFQRIFNPFSRNIMTERVHWCRKYSLQRSVTFS